MGRDEAELCNFRPHAVPDDLDVALPVELQVEAQLSEDVLVGVLEELLCLEPLVGLLFPISSLQPLPINHLGHPGYHRALDAAAQIQVSEVVAVGVVVAVVDPLPPGLLLEQGQLVRGQPVDVELVLTHRT